MVTEVQEAFERCLKRYPTVQLPFEVFHSRVNEIVLQDVSPHGEQSRQTAFPQIHHEDLFLALACSRDDRIAWEFFADDYARILRNYAVQACGDVSEGEDLAQEITAKLLKERNHFARYNGRGSLAGWLRAAVAHAAIDRYRQRRRMVSLEDLEEGGTGPVGVVPSDPGEEESPDSRWGPIISRVAGEKISALTARDRLILGLYYLHSVPLKTIGRQLGIHEATVSRWLDRLRHEIRKQVEKDLRKKHGLKPGEIQSLWKSISVSSVVDPIRKAAMAGTEEIAEKHGGCAQRNSARRTD